MKSPLKSPWTEGKSLGALKKLIPNGSVVHSFLFHDGTIEFDLSKTKRFVVSHTNKYANFEFWQCVLNDPERVAAVAEHFYPIENKNIFYVLQKNWLKYPDPFVRSGLYMLLSCLSDSGYATHGELTPSADIAKAINNLPAFSPNNFHLKFDKQDNIVDCINDINAKCDYIFLPIGHFSMNFFEDGKEENYVQTKVVHRDIKKLLDNTDRRVILLYKHSSMVKDFFKDYNVNVVDQWGRITESDKFAREIIVANF